MHLVDRVGASDCAARRLHIPHCLGYQSCNRSEISRPRDLVLPSCRMCTLQHCGFVGDVTALQLCSLREPDGESQIDYIAAGI